MKTKILLKHTSNGESYKNKIIVYLVLYQTSYMTEFNLLILEEDTETQMGPTFKSTISVIIILKWNHHKHALQVYEEE